MSLSLERARMVLGRDAGRAEIARPVRWRGAPWGGTTGFLGPGAAAPDPSRVVMVSAAERSTFEANMPSATDVQAALARPAALDPVYGDWLGSGPRITRRAVVPAFVTTVEYPWVMGATLSAADRAAFQAQLLVLVNEALQGVSTDFSAPTATPFDPGVNGSVAWWQSGAAQDTTTRTDPQTGLARLDQPDNPAGPTQAATTLGTLAKVAGVLLVGTAAVVAVVELGPLIKRG